MPLNFDVWTHTHVRRRIKRLDEFNSTNRMDSYVALPTNLISFINFVDIILDWNAAYELGLMA